MGKTPGLAKQHPATKSVHLDAFGQAPRQYVSMARNFRNGSKTVRVLVFLCRADLSSEYHIYALWHYCQERNRSVTCSYLFDSTHKNSSVFHSFM